MPRQLLIDDHIEYRGEALHRSNVDGPQMETKRHDFDRFTGITLDTTNRWAASGDNQLAGTSDTIAISEVQGGSCLITTGTVDNDSCYMSSAIIYSAAKRAVVEWRIKIVDVSGVALFVGFTDAKYEANNSLAIHYPDDVATYVAANCAGFVIDADHSTSSIMCASVKVTNTTPVDSGVDWADNETKTLRVELDTAGKAVFYLGGVAVGAIASAITAATLLCATVQAMTRAGGGATTVYVLSYDAWQDD